MFFQPTTNNYELSGDYELGAVKKAAPKKKAVAVKKKITASGSAGGTLKKKVTAGGSAGATLGGTRRVTITGTADFYKSALKTASGVQTEIRSDFEKEGWRIVNYDLALDGMISGRAALNLTAEVPNEYSNQAHLDQAYRTLGYYELWTGVATFKVFSNIQLRITGAEKPAYVPPKQTTITGTPTPRSNTNNGGADNDDGGVEDYWKKFKDNLGLSLGISGTTAIVVGGLFILVMLKK